jgi:hypothetical protein
LYNTALIVNCVISSVPVTADLEAQIDALIRHAEPRRERLWVNAAIARFVLKRAVEAFRHWRADVRKYRALRILLAHECELNHCAHKSLTDALTAIRRDFTSGDPGDYFIDRRRPGEIVVRQQHGNTWNAWPLPDARTDLMSKVMPDVATLDQSLLVRLEAACDSAINLRHVRESLLHFIESDDEHDKAIFRAFPECMLRELPDLLADWDKLYQECTGTELKVGHGR